MPYNKKNLQAHKESINNTEAHKKKKKILDFPKYYDQWCSFKDIYDYKTNSLNPFKPKNK